MNNTISLNRRVCVAPMLDKTDRHYRYFARLITQYAVLYTEMITTGALLQGDHDYHLKFSEAEHPLALQLGGSDPSDMKQCAQMAQDYGYDEVNINVGCPSDRVQTGSFGACLMATPDQVAECVDNMRNTVSIPVTIKTRIGIDDNDSYEALCDFIRVNHEAGCTCFIVHARKAWLKGLSPKENREIPPLRYDVVYQLKQDFPDLEIIINGGIKTLDAMQTHLQHVDGVMIGREAYSNPWLLSEIDRCIYDAEPNNQTRESVLQNLLPYLEKESQQGLEIKHITRHILGLYQGVPGARQWRRKLSEKPHPDLKQLGELFRNGPVS